MTFFFKFIPSAQPPSPISFVCLNISIIINQSGILLYIFVKWSEWEMDYSPIKLVISARIEKEEIEGYAVDFAVFLLNLYMHTGWLCACHCIDVGKWMNRDRTVFDYSSLVGEFGRSKGEFLGHWGWGWVFASRMSMTHTHTYIHRQKNKIYL